VSQEELQVSATAPGAITNNADAIDFSEISDEDDTEADVKHPTEYAARSGACSAN
jgi:hypothetical protein